MQVAVLNCGSSSVKCSVVEPASGRMVARLQVERVVDGAALQDALSGALSLVAQHDVTVVGHRVVHGGATFFEAELIDDQVVSEIRKCSALAPLHNPANLRGIEAARAQFPDLPHVAVFDTAFHARLPRRAKHYAIDPEWADDLGLRRYGFHGPSHAFVAARSAEFLQRPLNELRLVTLHLGNGASACAIEFGHSTETSMGFTPLEGLVMGTRSGDLDPGIVMHLVKSGLSLDEVERRLNKQSGLLGLSGTSHDLRDIEMRADDGDDRARLAINVFAHRVRKYVGAYATVMAGVDAIVLTGGIGENSAAMRRRILQRLEFLGLHLDEDQNRDAVVSDASPVAVLSQPHCRVTALAVKTNEALMIARYAHELINRRKPKSPARIPIAISARHLHLDPPTFAKLFGQDRTPTKLKDISQPGQFACEERVNLIGPRGRIDGVRLLGPLRPSNQLEISRTDEFRLGVDAPIRDSGKTRGSAPIVIEGPQGQIQLEEGLICARRHIHMSPKDAEDFGVNDGDEVEVAVRGGPRDLVFGDVLIRVSPKYVLEMHIDTDEGNAAELDPGASGDLAYSPTTGTASLRRTRHKLV